MVVAHMNHPEVPDLVATQQVLDQVAAGAACIETTGRSIDECSASAGLVEHVRMNGLGGVDAVEAHRQLGSVIETLSAAQERGGQIVFWSAQTPWMATVHVIDRLMGEAEQLRTALTRRYGFARGQSSAHGQ